MHHARSAAVDSAIAARQSFVNRLHCDESYDKSDSLQTDDRLHCMQCNLTRSACESPTNAGYPNCIGSEGPCVQRPGTLVDWKYDVSLGISAGDGASLVFPFSSSRALRAFVAGDEPGCRINKQFRIGMCSRGRSQNDAELLAVLARPLLFPPVGKQTVLAAGEVSTWNKQNAECDTRSV